MSTKSATSTLSGTATRTVSGQREVHVVTNPEPGQVVRLVAGSRLELRFARRGLGTSRWRVEDRPGHLVPLTSGSEGGHDFQFLVFGREDSRPQPLRLVRYRPDRVGDAEVRDLMVVVA